MLSNVLDFLETHDQEDLAQEVREHLKTHEEVLEAADSTNELIEARVKDELPKFLEPLKERARELDRDLYWAPNPGATYQELQNFLDDLIGLEAPC